MTDNLREVPELSSVDQTSFREALLTEHQPVVLRGLVRDWKLVKLAEQSDSALIKYLQGKAIPGPVKTVEAPAESGGRFFYSDDFQGFNFRRVKTTFYEFADRLLRQSGKQEAPIISLQSAYTDEYFSDVHLENHMPLMGDEVRSRIWVGGKTVVATHHDDAENIACVAAGRRRFVLFPPEQVPNLYIGPIDRTPAGAPVSMVSLSDPDLERFPRFCEALKHAVVAELAPGDAIYIPALWWHHVEAQSDVNVLVNYWQGGAIGGAKGPTGLDAMLLAMAALSDRSAPVKEAWRALFDHYVFASDAAASAHLPDNVKGFLGKDGLGRTEQIRSWLIRQLSEEE